MYFWHVLETSSPKMEYREYLLFSLLIYVDVLADYLASLLVPV